MSDLKIPRDNPNDDEVLITFVAQSGKQERGATLVSYETTKTQMDIVAENDGCFDPAVFEGDVVQIGSVVGSYSDVLTEKFTLHSDSQNQGVSSECELASDGNRFFSKRAHEFLGQTNSQYSGDLTFVCLNDLDPSLKGNAKGERRFDLDPGLKGNANGERRLELDQTKGFSYPHVGMNNGGCHTSNLGFTLELNQRISKLKRDALNNVYLDAFLHSAMTAFSDSSFDLKTQSALPYVKLNYLVGFISRKNELLVPYAITQKKVTDRTLGSIQDGLLSVLKGEETSYFRRQGAFVMFTDLTGYKCDSVSPLLYNDNHVMIGVTKSDLLYRFDITFDHRIFDAVDVCDFFSMFEEYLLRFSVDV